MQLWTDYEGLTIDNAFPLKKLLMPEGRSAFFSTFGTHGEPTVLRLVECHFDEQDILARWQSIDALNHPNFLKFERFGLTQLDNRPVVYAVFEKVDGNLAEVLDQGSLSTPDVTQLAHSLVAALDVLHIHGFVHEHIEPRNIFAIGSTVKLRADCIREAPEGQEGRAAKQRDVRDLATVLLQGLTQRSSLTNIPDSALPQPFRQIIRNTLDGTWGLADIKSALPPPIDPIRQPAVKNQASPTSTTASLIPSSTPAQASTPTTASTTPKHWIPPQTRPVPEANGASHPRPQLPLPLDKYPDANNPNTPFARKHLHAEASESSSRPGLSPRQIALGIAAILLLLVVWAIAHTRNNHHQPPQTATTTQPTSAPQQNTTPATAPIRTDQANQGLSAATTADWRVIAYTYNRRTDAEKKASDLSHTHPDLQPTVFTPTGHRPFLVSIGGRMDRATAHTLAHHARSLGFPRDTYAQNYTH